MPTTRKKVIKTVYKDEDDSDAGDFSDSGSDAKITDEPSSEDDEEEEAVTSGDEFVKTKKIPKQRPMKKPTKFAKSFISKINKQLLTAKNENENLDPQLALFTVKDLTEEDKLLPAVLNLSESDSSDDESPKQTSKPATATTSTFQQNQNNESDDESQQEYKDVFTNNTQDNSEEIARKTFLELEQHKSIVEEAKASIHSYVSKNQTSSELDIKDLLAQGGEVMPEQPDNTKKKVKLRKHKDDSDSEMEDWEEVKESKSIPQQGLQLIVDIPDLVCRKSKKVDIEMMMKRRMNRVKKEYQVYMHKVHVLCWIGHGNHLSKILNDQELLAAALSLVPSKECYPGERVDMKYLEHITTWYKDKFTLKQDKNENKFRPKAPPLKEILAGQIKSRVVTTRKYLVYIFVCMLRALGLQCRIMLNFVTLPIKPPHTELCSLSTKPKDEKSDKKGKPNTETKQEKNKKPAKKSKVKISQVDGNDDESESSDEFGNIAQLDGNDDVMVVQPRSMRARKQRDTNVNQTEDVSPPKRARKSPTPKTSKSVSKSSANKDETKQSVTTETLDSSIKSNVTSKTKRKPSDKSKIAILNSNSESKVSNIKKIPSPRKTRSNSKASSEDTIISDKNNSKNNPHNKQPNKQIKTDAPEIVVTEVKEANLSSKYFSNEKKFQDSNKLSLTRKRSKTTNPKDSEIEKDKNESVLTQSRTRTKSAPNTPVEKSKYFNSDTEASTSQTKKPRLSTRKPKVETNTENQQRVSHRDLAKTRPKATMDITGDLVEIVKGRIKEAKEKSKKGIVKNKIKEEEIDEDSDYLPEEDIKRRKSESDDDFKPTKLSPKPSTKKIDRRVISTSDEDVSANKTDVWCEIFVEELEQWISVDVVKGKVHCAEHIYKNATHPVCYVVGWDNNNHLKDLTRRYVPHWNTITRKQRAEPDWWSKAIQPWLGNKNARDREEDEQLDRMQLEAPLPKSISEYKNHPLYALKRHLLKFEAIYPPDAAALGFVRGEAVYARDCVYTCRSRDTWLKEAKVVRLKEEPYKIVKARPKWDKLSNKVISDKMVEIFGPWQVQDYEPPVAENGIVPRNAYGNVELFKDCMLPKGTVHIKLPGLNKVARKLNIDCAPAMTGFDFNGGWSHPVYDGFVVCSEFEEIITDAWLKDQEEQERREREKTESRVYGNWRRLIKGLFIRERLKNKYGFEEPSTSQDKKKSKGPRLVVKKKS